MFRNHIYRFLAVLLLLPTLLHAQDNDAYLLSAGDRLGIRIVAWQEANRQFELMTAVSGDYQVQFDGTLSMPLIGRIIVDGLTSAETGELVSIELQSKIGSIDPPSTSIEILEYRPLFIVGDVARPGSYPALPGITAIQAFAIAGGSRSSRDFLTSSNSREALRDQGALSRMLSEISRLKVRTVRLEAEVNAQEEIVFPENLKHPGGAETLKAVIAVERDIFNTRLSAYRAELSSLDGLKTLLNSEVESLETKLVGQIEQTELARETSANMKTLVDRGLARGNQFNEAQRTLFQMESQQLDLQNNIYRAQQRLREADRDIITIKSRRSTEATIQLQSTKAELEQLEINRNTLSRVLIDGGEALEFEGAPKPRIVFSLISSDPDDPSEMLVSAQHVMKPGDVLSVSFELE